MLPPRDPEKLSDKEGSSGGSMNLTVKGEIERALPVDLERGLEAGWK